MVGGLAAAPGEVAGHPIARLIGSPLQIHLQAVKWTPWSPACRRFKGHVAGSAPRTGHIIPIRAVLGGTWPATAKGEQEEGKYGEAWRTAQWEVSSCPHLEVSRLLHSLYAR